MSYNAVVQTLDCPYPLSESANLTGLAAISKNNTNVVNAFDNTNNIPWYYLKIPRNHENIGGENEIYQGVVLDEIV